MATDWKWIPEWEGYYQVSTSGGILSVGRKFSPEDEFLTPSLDSHGYERVSLKRTGFRQDISVHVAVALTFIGPRPEGMEVCHTNGDKLDNSLENLRYGTRKENAEDLTRHGNHNSTKKMLCPQGHPLKAPNLTQYSAGLGHRTCLACNRAWGIVNDHAKRGDVLDFEVIAAQKYEEILSGNR